MSDTAAQQQYRESVIRLAFGGDEQAFNSFVDIVRDNVPEAHACVIRGSSLTGKRYRDGADFDNDGPGTSDIDLTLVGGEVLRYYSVDGYWVPGMHSRPLSEDDPDIAPDLVPLRERLMGMVRRPVNIQGTRDWVQYFRGEILGQPYLLLYGEIET